LFLFSKTFFSYVLSFASRNRLYNFVNIIWWRQCRFIISSNQKGCSFVYIDTIWAYYAINVRHFKISWGFIFKPFEC